MFRYARYRSLSAALTATAVAALGITAGGCGGTSGQVTPNGTKPPSVVRIAWDEPVKTLDLSKTTDLLPWMIYHLMGGTLLNFNSDGTQAVPGLARSVVASDHGLRYTVNLRPGLKFSDGADLTAADVKASFEARLNNPADPNRADELTWTSIDTPAPTRVVINLKEPEPSLPLDLAAPWNTIFPASGLRNPAKFFQHPISDGPYLLSSLSSNGERIVLSLNPHYPDAKPVVPRVVFTDVEDGNQRTLQLQSNAIDVAGDLDPSALKTLSGNGITVKTAPLFGAYFIFMSDRKGPLANLNVRKAISLAANRAQMNSIVWDNTNQPLAGFFPSTMPGHVNNLPIKADPAAAKKLLAGTPCAKGCTIPIQVRQGRPIDQKSAVILSSDLAPIGIHVQIVSVDNAEASNTESAGTFSMEIEAMNVISPNPDTYLQEGLISNGGIDALFSGYKSAAMDAAANQAITSSGGTRLAALQRVNTLFARDFPYVPLYNYAAVNGLRVAVTPFVRMSPTSFFDIATSVSK